MLGTIVSVSNTDREIVLYCSLSISLIERAIKHIISECSKECYWIGRMIHRELCKQLNFDYIGK